MGQVCRCSRRLRQRHRTRLGCLPGCCGTRLHKVRKLGQEICRCRAAPDSNWQNKECTMRLPEILPTRPSQAGQPMYAFAALAGRIGPQVLDFLDPKKIKCAAACVPRAGYAACLARCLVDGQVCDGGLHNCTAVEWTSDGAAAISAANVSPQRQMLETCCAGPRSQAVAMAGHQACVIAWLAGPADVGPIPVDCAGRRCADIAHQSGTAIARAPHAPEVVGNQLRGDAIEVGVILGREPRPLPGERATRPAGLARERSLVFAGRRRRPQCSGAGICYF